MLLVETKRIARRTAVRRHARGLSDRPPDARNSASQNRPVQSSSKKITRTLQKQYSCHWWRRRGSNSRPYGCEPYALPAELRPHWLLCDYKIFFAVCQVFGGGLEKFFFTAPIFMPSACRHRPSFRAWSIPQARRESALSCCCCCRRRGIPY